MKRVTPSFLLVLCYAVLMTGIALGSVARGQSSGVGYIQLDSDYTWHYLGVTTPTPEEFTPVPTNTPTPTLTPSPTATPIPLCQGTTTAALNVRSGPGTTYTNLTNNDGSKLVYASGFAFAVQGWAYDTSGGLWLKTAVKAQMGYVYAQYVTLSGNCEDVPKTAPSSMLGLHITVGASWDVVAAVLDRLGGVKCTTGTEGICIGARQQRPDLIITYRVTSPDCPAGWGQGDGVTVAGALWERLYPLWQRVGMVGVANYFEPVNECGYGGSAWERAFWGEMIRRANAAGVCLALFSDSYGSPEVLEFQTRAAILDLVLEQPCRPGYHHAIAMHSYEGASSGAWKFGRWRLFMTALGDKYRAVPVLFTEYAYNFGTGPVDCTALWADWQAANVVYSADPQVWGVNYFNVSPIGQWTDVTKCLK